MTARSTARRFLPFEWTATYNIKLDIPMNQDVIRHIPALNVEQRQDEGRLSWKF